MFSGGWADDLGLLCGCNYVGVEIPLDDFPLGRERSSVARRVNTGCG